MKSFIKRSAALAALLFVLFPLCGAARKDDGFPILVNADNPLPADYSAGELTEIHHTRNDGRPVQLMQREAAEAIDAMLSALTDEFGESSGVSVTSAYRSRDYQRILFNSRVAEYSARGMTEEKAKALACRFVAEPGKSEHETGLAADLHNLACASRAFADTKEFLWLCENAADFGFILRYPQGKESITGIDFEPWHWRYVGIAAALEMKRKNLCLEEYVGGK